MLGGADNPNGELPSYITGADTCHPVMNEPCSHFSILPVLTADFWSRP
ncbi:InsB [Shigella sonnei]|nr:InsB [Shigella sonnei]CSF36097.1 InsB [Shigella sonnei]CSF69902.1 InsB [Shigella sonnei]CSF80263.1 InsB [Shigella sonnei]CSG08509.1 InsB [Shigella sonnei]